MKEYYIQDSELGELKKIGATAAIFFALGSALLGFAVNIQVGTAFADILPAVKSEWLIYRNVSIIAAIVSYAYAAIQALDGYNKVEKIKAETYHGSERYAPKHRYRVAIWFVLATALIILGMIIRSVLW